MQVARQLAQAYIPSLGISQAAANQTANAKPKKSPEQKKNKNATPQASFANFKVSQYIVMILNFCTDRPGQAV